MIEPSTAADNTLTHPASPAPLGSDGLLRQFTHDRQFRRVVRSPAASDHWSMTNSLPSTRVIATSRNTNRNKSNGPGGGGVPASVSHSANLRASSLSVRSIASARTFTSPMDMPSSAGCGAEWIDRRESRRRSAALRDFGIDPSHQLPNTRCSSVPERRGEPSTRSVAMR